MKITRWAALVVFTRASWFSGAETTAQSLKDFVLARPWLSCFKMSDFKAKNRWLGIAIFCLAASAAHAHGEQMLAMPIGQAGTLFVLLLVMLYLKTTRRIRLLFILAPLAAVVATYFIPVNIGSFSRHFGYGAMPWFVIGIVPPLMAAMAVWGYAKTRRSPPDQENS